jgi:hypothetical protein
MMPFIIVDFSIILLKPICPFIKQAITHHSPIPKLHISSAVNESEMFSQIIFFTAKIRRKPIHRPTA